MIKKLLKESVDTLFSLISLRKMHFIVFKPLINVHNLRMHKFCHFSKA